MDKRIRQYLGIAAALLSYYVVHEGAHLLYALSLGAFRQINFMGLGIQVDIYRERMTDGQLGVLCLLGAAATLLVALLLVALRKRICSHSSKPLKAIFYYVTLVMLILDPLYLSVLCGFFGGGDMNGIALLVPEMAARIGFGLLLIVNGLIFWKKVLPAYRAAFKEKKQ